MVIVVACCHPLAVLDLLLVGPLVAVQEASCFKPNFPSLISSPPLFVVQSDIYFNIPKLNNATGTCVLPAKNLHGAAAILASGASQIII